MTSERVDAAVERVRRRDPQLGRDAQAAGDWLTAGEGADMIDQISLQEFLWWHLPRKLPPTEWEGVLAGAAALLDELDLDRYADIVRSETSREILAAWRSDPDQAAELARRQEIASGVRPPDTELIEWGSVMGAYESMARSIVARALEEAMVAGEFTPGGRGWKASAAAVCDRTLLEPREEQLGQTLLGLVEVERAGHWLDSARVEQHRRWRGEVSRRIMNPIDPPEGVDETVAPVSWLLTHADAGIPLTQSNYLARALVVEAAERFGWGYNGSKPPRSEADIGELRAAAQDRRLVRRQGRKLLATKRGRSLASDPVALWRELSLTLGGTDEFSLMVAELTGLRLLDDEVVGVDGLADAIAPVLLEQGWRADGEPLGHRDIAWAVAHRLCWWRVLGLLDEQSPRWIDGEYVGEYRTALNGTGEASVLEFLRSRAVRPRHDLPH